VLQYYVHFVDDDPVLVYGPYALRSAKDFARIGSQPGKTGGGRRAVFDGPSPGSRLIRVYEEGDRVWPRTLDQIADLTESERPRILAPKQRRAHTSAPLAANPPAVPSVETIQAGLSWRAAGAAKDWQTIVSLVHGAMLHAEGDAPREFYTDLARFSPAYSTPEVGRARPRRREDAFRLMNRLLRTAGVEYLPSKFGDDLPPGYGTDYLAADDTDLNELGRSTPYVPRGVEYLKVGDLHVPTVCYDYGEHAWKITSVNDVVAARTGDFARTGRTKSPYGTNPKG
jgi:hypothetical protein